ncbi:MAG: peptidoglycan-associated lipoprotein Pal [Alphaproteobacteria bacterium]|nr:peptidoglycan-associated lipoprotein Pal [Alphaproteobacteria bacterium]
MLKYLLSITVFSLLVSCHSRHENDITPPTSDTKIEESIDTGEVIPYQTLDEQQVATMDQKTQDQLQEVEVQDRVFFGYDAFDLDDESKKILDVQVAWLKSDLNINIIVEGHCDERGTREYNIALGEKRANSVKKYLVKNGIASARIKIVSYGKERPAFFGATEEIFNKNRRAVTVVN